MGLNFFQTLIARHPQDKFTATVLMSFLQLVSHVVQIKIPCWEAKKKKTKPGFSLRILEAGEGCNVTREF